MNRTLKRPMFKMGGSSATGITSGLDMPRASYQFGGGADARRFGLKPLVPTGGGADARFFIGDRMMPQTAEGNVTSDASDLTAGQELLKAFEDREKANNLSNFLINFGLNLASATPRGKGITGTFATAAEAAKEPFGQFTKEAALERGFDRELKLAATEMDINQRLKQEAEERQAIRDKEAATAKFIRDQILQQPKDTRTAILKNADELEKLGVFKTPEDKAKYIQAATLNKGSGFKVSFDDAGRPIITQGDIPEDKEIRNKANEIANTAFQLNNAGMALINQLKGAKVGPTGAFINALDSAGSQIVQAGEFFGIGSKENYIDEGSGAIDKYLEDKFGTALAKDAVRFAKIKSVAINLAYLMAKADEPGGRFTDRDIALKMEEIGLGANPEKTIAVLTNSINLRNENLNFNYNQLTNENLDFSKIKGVGDFASSLKDSGSKKDSSIKSEPEEFKFINGVLHKKVNGIFTDDF